jgi:hypothetical protein
MLMRTHPDQAAEAAQRFGYLGACMTPAEADAKVTAAVAAVAPAPAAELRGLAALGASSIPDPPPELMRRKDAIRNHLLIFAGTLFGFTPGESTSLSGVQHGGVLVGMLLVALVGSKFAHGRAGSWHPGQGGLAQARSGCRAT